MRSPGPATPAVTQPDPPLLLGAPAPAPGAHAPRRCAPGRAIVPENGAIARRSSVASALRWLYPSVPARPPCSLRARASRTPGGPGSLPDGSWGARRGGGALGWVSPLACFKVYGRRK